MTQLSKKLTILVKSAAFLHEAANAANRAYHVTTGGDPAAYVPFGTDAAGDILNNLPPVWAVLNASLDLGGRRGGGDEHRLSVLRDMAEGKLAGAELLTARLYMNATWRQRNADRDLARTARDICDDYGLLLGPPVNEKEIAKDDHLLVAVANTLISKLED